MRKTLRHARFIAEYPLDCNAKAAAIRAGYAEANAASVASRLLADPEIAAGIRDLEAPMLEKAKVSLERLLDGAACIAFVDCRRLYHADGTLKAVHELESDVVAGTGVEATQGRHTFKVHNRDKLAALMLLGRHVALSQRAFPQSASVQLDGDPFEASSFAEEVRIGRLSADDSE